MGKPVSSFGRYHVVSLEVHENHQSLPYLVTVVWPFLPAAFKLAFTLSTAARVSPLAAFFFRYHIISEIIHETSNTQSELYLLSLWCYLLSS